MKASELLQSSILMISLEMPIRAGLVTPSVTVWTRPDTVDTREFGGKASEGGIHMPKKTGLRYPEEFKAEAIQLVRSFPEKSIRQLAYELGIADQTLRN
jgi:hypothetical protein